MTTRVDPFGNRLPSEIVSLIYEFDGEKRDRLNACFEELSTISSVVNDLTDLLMYEPFPFIKLKKIRGIAHKYRKRDLKLTARFLRVRLPRKVTKLRILLHICYIISFHNVSEVEFTFILGDD